jgi:translocation and assembly module TamA
MAPPIPLASKTAEVGGPAIQRTIRTLLAMAACCIALAWPGFCHAQSNGYIVVIEGACDFAPLLDKYLLVAARRDELAKQPQRLRTLIDRTPEEAQAILAAEGYLDAKMTTRTEGDPIEKIVITVELGDPIIVRTVDIRFTGAIAGANPANTPSGAAVRRDWPFKIGDRFRQTTWDDAKAWLLRELRGGTFPAAQMQRAQATIDADARTAALEVEIDSGPAFRFGELEISGLKRYPESVVRNLNTIRAGEPFSQRALAELQTRLYTVPYFAAVTVSVEPQSAVDPAALPIRIAIEEAARYKVDLGAGYSTNTGLRLQAAFTDINFFDKGWRWKNSVRYEEREQRVETGIVLPVRSDGWQDEFGANLNRTDVSSFIVESYNITYKHAKSEGRIERAFTGQAIVSREYPEGGSVNTKQALVPGFSWIYRDFDDLLDPRRGYEIGGQISGGSKRLYSDQNFVRLFGRAIGLVTLANVNTFIIRAEGGIVMAPSRQDIPASLLFRAGGDQSIRGYGYQSIGVTDGLAIVGGRYLLIGSAEYIRWIQPKWGVAAFIEAGDAYDDFEDIRFKRGFGIGARWRSPVGPINFDVAYGQEARSTRVHFSIGFVF